MKHLDPIEWFFLCTFIASIVLLAIGTYGAALYMQHYQPWAHKTLSPSVGQTEFAWALPYFWGGMGILFFSIVGWGSWVYSLEKSSNEKHEEIAK
jgi:amino acid transporter